MENIEDIKQTFLRSLENATGKELEDIGLLYMGRKGKLLELTKALPLLPVGERPKAGKELNELKAFIKTALREKKEQTKGDGPREHDLTVPGKKVRRGHRHPLTLITEEMTNIFSSLNFSVVEGPEVETEHYNFNALNMPENHPARDLWDTFWLQSSKAKNLKLKTENLLLRTHNSPMQVRFMETHEPPLRIVVPGRSFRYEASDATHEIQFYQLEGLFVDRKVSVAHFKGVMELFFKKLFKDEFGGLRLRPSYFPFVEPGFEVDFYWKSKEKWLEIMGAGMVHPKVFEAAGFAPGEWQGFAFGLGIDRVAMLKYKIPDIRLFYSGDLRVIKQF